MAGLPLPPGFGTNSWDELTWADAMAASSSRFRVADADAWKASPASGLDRTVQIAAGGGWCCGVWDRTAAPENAPQHDTNTGSNDRFDVVVARYNWTTRTRTFAVIKGTGTPPALNTTQSVDASKVNRLPRVRYDGVVAVVRVRPGVGPFSGTDIVDQRTWGSGAGGPALIANMASRPQIDRTPGQRIAAVTAPHIAYAYDGTRWVQEGVNTTVAATPAGCYVSKVEDTAVPERINDNGFFVIGLPTSFAFSAPPLWLDFRPGVVDNSLAVVVADKASSVANQLYGFAYARNGAGALVPMLAANAYRVDYTAVGYNT